jgi:nucleoside phosphorylase/CheY-like chemotaxis protein
MRVLIVEDDTDKRQAITRALLEVDGLTSEDIDQATDGFGGRRALALRLYDLLILDIAIPPRADLDIDPSEGVRLLEELLEDEGTAYKTPAHVIGITAYDDIFEATAGRFASRSLTLLHFDPTSTSWIGPLQARTGQILSALASQHAEKPEYLCDVAVISALQSPELESVRQFPWDWEHVIVPGDHTLYWRGSFDSGGRRRCVYAAASARMGIAAASVLTGKVIQHFRPRLLLMVGIAAGVRGKVNFGDVVVADPCWDWGSGKWVVRDGRPAFMAAPHQVALDGVDRERLVALSADTSLLAHIRGKWPAPKPDSGLQVHIGPVASGAAVLADGVTIEQVLAQHRQLLAIDMEAYGVMTTAQESTEPRPRVVVLKGIVDFADGQKDDRFRHYSAFTSAEVMRAYVIQMLG